MKKLISTACLLLAHTLIAQTPATPPIENGLNKLLNNPNFIEEVVQLKGSDLSLNKLNEYLGKYAPEYSNQKINPTTLNINSLYFANTTGTETNQLNAVLSKALNLNPTQSQLFKGVLNANFPSNTSNSAAVGNLLYARGKDPKTDAAVDLSVDFFKSKLGSTGVNGALSDVAGGVLGNLITRINKRYYEKLAEEQRISKLNDDDNVYRMGSTSYFDAATRKYVTGHAEDQNDLYNHYNAKLKMPTVYGIGSSNAVNYSEAINSLNKAIAAYQQNQDRAYYLYLAYVDRAQCKMEVGAYKEAVVDYYFAEDILKSVLGHKLPDRSIKNSFPKGYLDASNKATYLKGKMTTKEGILSNEDQVILLINRAFAKYRAADFAGSLADCGDAQTTLKSTLITKTISPNGPADIILAIIAMNEYGRKQYTAAMNSFSSANLTADLIGDLDNDGVVNFFDLQKNFDPIDEETRTNFGYGFPDYFPFDIIQIQGLCLFKNGKMDEAIGLYESLVNSENKDLKYSKISSKAFTKVGGDISSVYSTLASFYFEKKNTQQAISLLNKAIELNPTQLEYYAKRGKYKAAMGLKAESESDFAFIKNPTQVTATKKSEDYFKTKLTEYASANKNEELFATLKEAIKAYPANAELLDTAFKFLIKTKDQAKCAEMGALFPEDNANQHLFKSMAANFANDSNLAYTELETALKSGATLYDIQKRFIDLPSKSYYCKLLFTYASTSNNSFVPKVYDKVKIKAAIDSIYESLPSYKNATGMTKNILDKTKFKQIAKDCGNYSEYLDLLDNEPQLLEMSPSHALNKIECLVILNRKDEAIKFAKKIVSKGKMQPMQGEEDYKKIHNNWISGVNNIANGPCN